MKEVIMRYKDDKDEGHSIVENVGDIIRCKDCKWWSDKTSYRDFPICADYERSMSGNDYCSRAERKKV